MRIIFILFLWASLLCCWHRVAADTIVIEKVTCVRVATGIDPIVQYGAQALGAIYEAREPLMEIAGTLAENGLGAIGELPLTLQEVYEKAQDGWSEGLDAIKYIDSATSGTDDLIININGEKVYPASGDHGSISAGGTLEAAEIAQFDFDGHCRIQLIEYDWGSDNDNLGFIEVNDNVSPGQNYRVEDALAFSDEEGDLYRVTYRVERNERGRDPKWMLCGTAACKECTSDCCRSDTNEGLDRDGDEDDIRTCPPGFSNRGWITYDLWWPADDVYLRICGNDYASSEWGSYTVEVDGYYKKMMRKLAGNRASRMLKAQAVEHQNAPQNVLREALKMLRSKLEKN